MNRDVYLSVDLDYWHNKTTGSSLDFVGSLFELERPITVFTEHHLVLKDITKQYRKVYNVDFHSDLSETAWRWPNCGTWVNFVYGRENAEFEWRYPSRNLCITKGWGLCHTDHENGNEFDPFNNKSLWTWKNISRKNGLSGIEMDKVDRVSLVLSPAWSQSRVILDTLIFINDSHAKFFSKSAKRVMESMMKGTV
jgi:hypothetical protein